MKNSQKGFILPLLIIIIAIVIIGGGIYSYKKINNKTTQDPTVESIVASSTNIQTTTSQPKLNINKKDELPVYIFQDYSSFKEPQAYFEGTLAPIKIQGYEMLKNVDVSIRCWKKAMTCAWGMVSLNYAHPETKLYEPAMTGQPTVGILSISEWNQNKIVAKGNLGNSPNCEKDVCAFLIELNVNLGDKTVIIKNEVGCLGSDCGSNDYLLVGSDDTRYTGEKALSPKIPVPIIDIQPSA